MPKIVFTNGCFDILHRGHIELLEEAKKLGDVLIIGLNSDSSIKRLKGRGRPINNQEDRIIILRALKDVDKVMVFYENSPLNLIKQIKPDVLVKGGDWKVEDIIGHELVLENGGEVYSIPFKRNYSTTGIISKIKNLNLRK